METHLRALRGLGCTQGAGDRLRARPEPGGGRRQELAEFKTTVAGLLSLRDWLETHGASQVALEATGVYWKPV